MLLGALTSDLLQDTSDISIDADGFCSNFSGCIGFPQIDAGVGSVFPGGGHTPEGIFDDAGVLIPVPRSRNSILAPSCLRRKSA